MKLRTLVISFVLFVLSAALFLNRPSSGGAAPSDAWWDALWPYRVDVTIDAAGYERHDKVAEVPINFTELLDDVGDNGRFNPDSIRVLEVVGGQIVDDAVPFQFDQAADYNANNNAAGTLTIMMSGLMPADAVRTYQVYFDVVGTDYQAPDFQKQVRISTITDSYGFETYKLITTGATYYFHTTGGGFASMIDEDDNDWISWNPAPQDAGDSRGIPNMVHPNDGGYFHPGRTSVAGTTNRGPLKVSIRSFTPDKAWMTVWDIFPTYARLTVTKVAEGKAYWLLYEGTPGGVLEPATDLITLSDGATTTAATAWTGDIPGEEWLYFTDPALDRSLYVIHHEEDEIVDSYTPSTKKLMTVFGFGRSGNNRYLTGTSNEMTIGLVDESTLDDVGAAVHNAYKPLDAAVGSAEERPFTPTPSPSPTTAATETPTETPTPLPTNTPSSTPEPTNTPTKTATPTMTATHIPTKTPKPTRTPKPTATPKVSPTAEVTASPSPTATATRPSGGAYAVYLGFVVRE